MEPAECSSALPSVLHQQFPLQRVIVDGGREGNAVIEAHATGARLLSPLLTGRLRRDSLCLGGGDATPSRRRFRDSESCCHADD